LVGILIHPELKFAIQSNRDHAETGAPLLNFALFCSHPEHASFRNRCKIETCANLLDFI